MGLKTKVDQIPFTTNTLDDRNLIIRMLKHEDTIIFGDTGQSIYSDPLYRPRESLTPEYAIHRKVLSDFGFDTSDQSVDVYRKIFGHYYHSPTDYDPEVLSSVAYMRENRCVYYTEPLINVGDTIQDCLLYNLDGTMTSVKESLNDFTHAMIAGFSSS